MARSSTPGSAVAGSAPPAVAFAPGPGRGDSRCTATSSSSTKSPGVSGAAPSCTAIPACCSPCSALRCSAPSDTAAPPSEAQSTALTTSIRVTRVGSSGTSPGEVRLHEDRPKSRSPNTTPPSGPRSTAQRPSPAPVCSEAPRRAQIGSGNPARRAALRNVSIAPSLHRSGPGSLLISGDYRLPQGARPASTRYS